MTERNLDLSIELINNCMFRVEIYDPESGDHARATFDDSDVAELKSFLADEILGWVSIMRDNEEARVAEEFARHEHEKAMSEESYVAIEDTLAEKISNAHYTDIEEVLGYPISADVLENLEDRIRDALDELTEDELLELENKYLN